VVDFGSARTQLITSLTHSIHDKRVLDAIANVPRELFVTSDYYHCAYDDRPLSIGYGQTISQPLIVAMMTEALELRGYERVLEVGTGSGYQTAILAQLAREVVSVERIPQMVEFAKRNLDKIGYSNVEIYLAQKLLGWIDKSPYESIIVTAASPCIPRQLLYQLSCGGKIVIPVGSKWKQELLTITKGEKKNITRNLGGCRFVPLIGEGAWEDDD
jgi:protein-L-isoaspartate(D-aspartate) O-methyltransferase